MAHITTMMICSMEAIFQSNVGEQHLIIQNNEGANDISQSCLHVCYNSTIQKIQKSLIREGLAYT